MKVSKHQTLKDLEINLSIRNSLRNWIAMRELGVLDCEIYYGYNNAIMVQKLWQTDIYNYIRKKREEDDMKMNENLFTNIDENIALFMKTVCPQLKKIHDAGLLHDDIKPGNFVMDLDKEKNKPVAFGIIDFDNARWPREHEEYIVGTKYYAPPEAIGRQEGGYRLTTKYDIWGLGLSLIEMITFKHPIAERGALGVNYKTVPIEQKEIDDILDESDVLNEDKNKEFKDLLKNMTNTSLDDRFDIDQVMNHSWYKIFCNEVVCR